MQRRNDGRKINSLKPSPPIVGNSITSLEAAKSSGPDPICWIGKCDLVNEHDTEIAHPDNGINTSETTTLQANLAIRHRQGRLAHAHGRAGPE